MLDRGAHDAGRHARRPADPDLIGEHLPPCGSLDDVEGADSEEVVGQRADGPGHDTHRVRPCLLAPCGSGLRSVSWPDRLRRMLDAGATDSYMAIDT